MSKKAILAWLKHEEGHANNLELPIIEQLRILVKDCGVLKTEIESERTKVKALEADYEPTHWMPLPQPPKENE